LDLSGRKWEAGEDCTVRSYNLYASPYIIKMIASRRRRGRGHVAHIGEMRNIYRIVSENLKDHLGDVKVPCMGR